MFKSKTLANGKNPLMLQVCKDGKRKYKSLGIHVNQKHWDFNKNRPKHNCPDGEYIQQIILNKVSELQKQVLNYSADNKKFTVGNLVNGGKQKVVESKVGEFFKVLITEYENSGNMGNRRAHKGTLIHEQWVYEPTDINKVLEKNGFGDIYLPPNPYRKTIYLYFENGKLTSWQD